MISRGERESVVDKILAGEAEPKTMRGRLCLRKRAGVRAQRFSREPCEAHGCPARVASGRHYCSRHVLLEGRALEIAVKVRAGLR